MKEDKQLYNLSRRKVLGGLGAVGLASAGAGLGTSALFSDTEVFQNNTLEAGEMNLVVDYHSHVDQGTHGVFSVSGTNDGGDDSGEPITSELTDVKPGDNGLLAFCFEVVDNPGYLWLCGDLTGNDENGQTEPEADVDTTFGDPGPGEGELAQSIVVDVNYCHVADDLSAAGEAGFDPADVSFVADLFDGTLAEFLDAIDGGQPLDADGNADAGETGFLTPGDQECFAGTADAAAADNVCVCIDWEVPETVGNEIQTDSVTFDVEFHAQQCRFNDGTVNPCAGEAVCEPCTLPSVTESSPEVTVLSTDASAYPDVSMFVQVDTVDGNDGTLTTADFVLCEGGYTQDITVNSASSSKADIVFVFDDTGSMGSVISSAKSSITTFVDNLTTAGLDARFALISFKDVVELDLDFTADKTTIQGAINALSASGGGDTPEDDFDAIAAATHDKAPDSGGSLGAYRPGAQRVIIDITDAPAQVDNSVSSYTMAEVEGMLAGFTYIAVSPTAVSDPAGDKHILADNVGGTWYDLYGSSFGDLLTNEVTGLLTTTYTVSYTACNEAEAGTEQDVLLQVNDPEEGDLYGMDTYTVPTPP
ncbi:MAG: vWA domain-containing protein [Haloarculaceae archaeon]